MDKIIILKNTEVIDFLTVLVFTVIFIVVILILFIVFFFNTKSKYFREKINKEKTFERELSKSKVEVQDETLNYVGREIHDNVGQILSVAKIKLISFTSLEHVGDLIEDVDNTIGMAIEEIRKLSRTLAEQSSVNFDLIKSLNLEYVRIKKISNISVVFNIIDKPIHLENDIMIFRLIQEILANSLKHSKASKFQLNMEEIENHLIITFKDNGKGFNVEEKLKDSNGLKNLYYRADLLQGQLQIHSWPDRGTETYLKIPLKNTKHSNT